MKNYPAENLVNISAPLPQLQAEKRIGTRVMLMLGGGSQFLAQGPSPQSVVLVKVNVLIKVVQDSYQIHVSYHGPED